MQWPWKRYAKDQPLEKLGRYLSIYTGKRGQRKYERLNVGESNNIVYDETKYKLSESYVAMMAALVKRLHSASALASSDRRWW